MSLTTPSRGGVFDPILRVGAVLSIAVMATVVVWDVGLGNVSHPGTSSAILWFPYVWLSLALALALTGDVASSLAVALVLIPAQVLAYGVVAGKSFMQRNWRPAATTLVVHVIAVLICLIVIARN